MRALGNWEKRGTSKLILIGLIWLGFWLCLHHIDRFSFWIDEGLTPIRSGYSLREILSQVIIVQGHPTTDTHPPLYYLIIAVTRRLFGESDFAFRFPSALFAVASIPLIYQLGRRIGRSERVGRLAALWLAISPLVVWYAQEARMYTLLNFFGIGLTLVLWEALRTVDSNQLTVTSEGSKGERRKEEEQLTDNSDTLRARSQLTVNSEGSKEKRRKEEEQLTIIQSGHVVN